MRSSSCWSYGSLGFLFSRALTKSNKTSASSRFVRSSGVSHKSIRSPFWYPATVTSHEGDHRRFSGNRQLMWWPAVCSLRIESTIGSVAAVVLTTRIRGRYRAVFSPLVYIFWKSKQPSPSMKPANQYSSLVLACWLSNPCRLDLISVRGL